MNGHLLKMITNKNYKVDLPKLTDEKLMFDFARGMNFDEKFSRNKSTRHKSPMRLLQSLAVMASSSRKSKPKRGFYDIFIFNS